MGIDFDRGIPWWILTAILGISVGILLHRRKVVNDLILVWLFTPLTILVSNLVAIWYAAPDLIWTLKLLLALSLTLPVIPFLLIGEVIRKSRQTQRRPGDDR